jgi:hydroxymethylglutaryl-CoA reductase
MVQRGGGVEDLKFRKLGEEFLVVELLVNVQDSMGANVINSIAEHTAPYIREIIGQGRIGIRILSNLCTERMTMSEFSLPVEGLAWKTASGKEVAEKVLEA